MTPHIMEKAREPQTVQYVDYICDNCGEGHMLPTGIALLSYPAKYEHKCTKCGSKQYFKETYPAIRYLVY